MQIHEDEREFILQVYEQVGRNRGCLSAGARVDWLKTAQVLLNDLRSGKLGRITLELPNIL